MPLNIYPRAGLWAAAIVLFVPGGLHAQDPCPPVAGAEVAAGWRAYRADSVAAARDLFRRADRRCDHNFDAKVGLGYTMLRESEPARADSLFRIVVRAVPSNADAWLGLALAAERRGDRDAALVAARRALDLNPGDASARSLLDRQSPGWNRPPPVMAGRPALLRADARTRGRRFEVPDGAGRWRPFYIKGVNLGAALPGKFPAEFPTDSALYARWIGQIAGMNANVIRLYTILPPQFYRALLGWNRTNPRRAVWLVHGVWTELPPGDNFNDAGWKGEFREEMRRVVDLVHGAAEIAARPGHAAGRYDADVSRWTLGYIIGREWEPFAVKAFDEATPGRRPYTGRFLVSDSAPAADRWMAEQADAMLAHEVDRYNTIRPISYTNWPTLDPLTHPTEATTAEESEWRRRSGKPGDLVREYENDAIGLDASLVRPTEANPAGWFASYHAYPYYPDFMLLDPGYNRARSSEGRSNYFGYLRDLVRHHADIPVVIAEYGVPSSRGIAHLQPQGWHHGGHDENAMARIDARLTREIRESGAAGGIIFAWMDEWFKKNWVVVDLEIPGENNRLWHNAMDAEQNYGMLGMYAGEEDKVPRLGGDPARWLAGTRLYAAPGENAAPAGPRPAALHASSDESYLYLAASFPALRGRPFPWATHGVMIAIDTWLPRGGQHALPDAVTSSDIGFEFLVDLRNTGDAEIRILPEYNPYGGAPDSSGDDVGRFYRRPVTVGVRHDGIFDSMYVGTNRARYGRDGTFFPARGVNRGRLRHGTAAASSLSDWYYDPRSATLQVRIPWGLLNVTDPSTRTLVHETQAGESFGTVTAQDWHFGLVTYRHGRPRRAVAALPALDGIRWRAAAFRPWRWQGWETPAWHSRLKPAYRALQQAWRTMP